jgi:hypothetical protein
MNIWKKIGVLLEVKLGNFFHNSSVLWNIIHSLEWRIVKLQIA